MKITVTGGKGFIGEPTARIGKEMGHEVSFFDRRDGNNILGDLGPLEGSDAVIHLAGLLGTHELFDDIEAAIETNVLGSYRIMQWCLLNRARYVGILMPDVFPSVYRATKIASYNLAQALHHSKGLKVSHVRAFNAFGPGQAHGPGHAQKILPTFAVNAWRGVPLPIWGDGNQTVDLVYVDDVARLLIEAVEFSDGQIFDAGTGIPMSVRAVAEMVKGIAMSEAPLQYLPMRDGEEPTTVVATGHGWDLLHPHLRPKFRYLDLVNTVQWYRHYPANEVDTDD
jgi:UDP-glucose 4-epimerase